MSLRDWFIAPPPARDEWLPPSPDPPSRPAELLVSPHESGHAAGDSPDAPSPRARDSPPAEVAGAAVIGRAGEVEPLAAGLALALRGVVAALAATVVVVGELEDPAAGGGTPAARRLAARLDAHGFDAIERGRLVWVRAPAATAARAAVVGAPAVLAVTAPLTPELEAAIAEQDLAVVVSDDPDGPLATLAAGGLARPRLAVVTSRPLPRGLARLLARAGVAAPRRARDLVAG